MLNVPTNAKNLILFLFATVNIYSNPPDSIPIAEYCVGYERPEYYDNCYDDDYIDTAKVHLYLTKILQKLPEEENYTAYYCSSYGYNSSWINKFLIHEDLNAQKEGDECVMFWGSWIRLFARNVPVYAKNEKSFDFDKYYEKNKIIQVEWEQKSICGSFYDATFSGTYFIRITGKCDSIPSIKSYLKLIKCNSCGVTDDAK